MSKRDQIRFGAEVGPNTRLVERRRGDRVERGVLGPLQEGKPIPDGAELVRLRPGDDEEWYDVESLYWREDELQYAPAPEPVLSGPPQVATPAYRDGYDRIFGKKPAVGLA